MGEAKRRGSFEQRQAEGIAKRNAENERLAKERKLWKIAHKPSKNTIALAALLVGLGDFRVEKLQEKFYG